MKLTWKQIEPFIKNPDPKARAVLIYGPDNGLMRERAKAIGKTVVPDLNDPFNVVVLNTDQLIDDPARLSDEAQAISMMGGARLIRIDSAEDKIAPIIQSYLESPSQENLVIVEAGELSPRSALRGLFEKADNAAALPCYIEDERGISQIIRQMVQEAGLSISPDAQAWLAVNIAGDRQRARGEIEKLILYKGPEGGHITIDDAQAACGEAGAQSLDDLVYAIGGANPALALSSFTKLVDEGVAVITILRSVQNHFRRIHYTKSLIRQGEDPAQALKKLQPPIFFKYEPAFKSQIQKWDIPKLDKVLMRLSDLEAQTKQTGTPVETLCAQAILSISSIR